MTWSGGHRSRVDQVCLDIPQDRYEEECAFWSELTGWPVDDSKAYAEFRRLRIPDGTLMKVLLQRLDEPTGPVRAHLDLATDDRPAETARHVELGAAVVDTRRGWTVLRDPAGTAFCITDRSP
ncbi:MAG: VOC family protein [Nocardioides sp.]